MVNSLKFPVIHTKFQPSWFLTSGEDSLMVFIRYEQSGHHGHVIRTFNPQPIEHPCENWLKLFQVIWKCWWQRTMMDGQQQVCSTSINSQEAFGSCEPKKSHFYFILYVTQEQNDEGVNEGVKSFNKGAHSKLKSILICLLVRVDFLSCRQYFVCKSSSFWYVFINE